MHLQVQTRTVPVLGQELCGRHYTPNSMLDRGCVYQIYNIGHPSDDPPVCLDISNIGHEE